MSNEVRIVQDKTFDVIQSAVNKMVDMVRPTFGPASNKVIIDKFSYRMVVDDGVQIARDFELSDPAENAVVKVIRETAVKTNDRVGDGTTGALIMLQAIINEVSRKTKRDGRKVELELLKGLEEVKSALAASARQIETKEELKKVALVSFDNEVLAEMIADLYFKLGKDATITVDKSPTMETSCEISSGVTINHGYISPYMITNPERMEAIVERPYILFTDYRITEVNDILPLMDKLAKENKRELVVICDNMEQSALATAVINKLQSKFLLVAVVAPSGDNRKVMLEDMALMTGAKMFTNDKGHKLQDAELADLGRAERFICRRDESIIVGPQGNKESIDEAIKLFQAAADAEQNEKRKKEALRRVAVLKNTLAVIKVGAPTETEQKSLKYKVEDCVNAVKAAYKGGVVCGGGLWLARQTTSSPILNEALKCPARQLLENMGMDEVASYIDNNTAHNVVTGESGNFMDVGVMDPADVLLAAVESAVSIASILVTSSGILVEVAKEKE